MNRKTVVSFFVMISIVVSMFGTAFADSSNSFKSNGDYYKWNFTSSSGLLTIDALYKSSGGYGTNYASVASSVTSMTINSIHYSYDSKEPYEFSGIINGLDNLKTITVNSSCSALNNLKNCPALQTITFNNNKAKKTRLDFYRSNVITLPAIAYDKNNTSNYFLDFNEYYGSTSVTIPASYGNDSHITYCFTSSRIKSVSFASGTKTIPEYAFENCTFLSSVTIPSGVTTIYDGAFYGCSSLRSVTIPESVKTIYYNAFYGSEIATVNYGGTRDQWFELISGKNILYLDSATVHCKDGDIIIKKTVSGNNFDYIQYPTGWYKKDSKWYYYENDGTMLKNCVKEISGYTYRFDSNGAMTTGWYQNNGKTFYFDPATGAMKTNSWKSNGDKWYYLGSDGAALTSWQTIDKLQYYFGKDGVMVTGKKQINGSWYYFNNKGAMQTGWLEISGSWYYFNSKGVMQTGWQDLGVAWYYFDENGILLTGWQKIGNFWYYLGSNGAMVTGWKKIDGSWYHFNEDGMMATGEMKIDGKIYHFKSNGVWLGY